MANGGQAMDKDRIEGAAKQVKGAVKDMAGKVTGDTKLQAEGQGRQGGRARCRTLPAGPRMRRATPWIPTGPEPGGPAGNRRAMAGGSPAGAG